MQRMLVAAELMKQDIQKQRAMTRQNRDVSLTDVGNIIGFFQKLIILHYINKLLAV